MYWLLVYWSVRGFISSSTPILIVLSNYCHFLSVLKAEIKAWDPWEVAFQMYTTALLCHCSELRTLRSWQHTHNKIKRWIHTLLIHLWIKQRIFFLTRFFFFPPALLFLYFLGKLLKYKRPHRTALFRQTVSLHPSANFKLVICMVTSVQGSENKVLQLNCILQVFLPERKRPRYINWNWKLSPKHGTCWSEPSQWDTELLSMGPPAGHSHAEDSMCEVTWKAVPLWEENNSS